MIKKLFLLLLVGQASLFTKAQLSSERLNQLKKLINQSKQDTSTLSLAIEIARGYRFSNTDSSLFYTDRALSLANKLGSVSYQAQALSLKGATLLETGRLPESLYYQFEALKISEKLKDTTITAFAVNRIGNTYMELGDYRKANEYYFLSGDLFERSRNPPMYYNEMSNIGNVYELMGMADSALYYLQLVDKAASKEPSRNFITRPEMLFRLGNAWKLKGDNEKALACYKKGIVESYIDNDIRNLTMNNLFLAKLYNEMNLQDSSMKYARNAIESGKAVSFRKGVQDAFMLLSGLFNKRNQYDSAYAYLSRANIEKDSLTGTKRFQELQGIILNKKEEERKVETKRVADQNKQKQLFLLVGLGVFLVVAVILYRNNNQKQKTNKVLEKTLRNLQSTQAQLVQSEKMASLGELTAGIAHEIQNPLNFVNNFSEVNTELLVEMKDEIDKGNLDEVKAIANDVIENQQKINHHGKRADAIVKGMLQHSRSSNGQKEPTDINALADEYLRLAYHGLRAKDKSFNATMKTDFDESIGKINIIPQDIGRVILNLITNAFYVVDEKKKSGIENYEPTISVNTKKINGYIEIKVADNGSGIPTKVLDKIFQPFFTTKPTGQGTGLGLSLSYDIVKAHGGEIKVTTKENEGTEFIIQLPNQHI